MLLEKNLHFSLLSTLEPQALISFHNNFLITHPEQWNPSSCEGAGSRELEEVAACGGDSFPFYFSGALP